MWDENPGLCLSKSLKMWGWGGQNIKPGVAVVGERGFCVTVYGVHQEARPDCR